jgi:hypothetical protein
MRTRVRVFALQKHDLTLLAVACRGKGGLMRYAPMKLLGIGQQIIVRKSTSLMTPHSSVLFCKN